MEVDKCDFSDACSLPLHREGLQRTQQKKDDEWENDGNKINKRINRKKGHLLNRFMEDLQYDFHINITRTGQISKYYSPLRGVFVYLHFQVIIRSRSPWYDRKKQRPREIIFSASPFKPGIIRVKALLVLQGRDPIYPFYLHSE